MSIDDETSRLRLAARPMSCPGDMTATAQMRAASLPAAAATDCQPPGGSRAVRRFGRQSAGFTLIEIIITLVVVTAAVAAIAGLVANLAGGSADPVIHTQAIYLAESYLEESALRPYSDPDGVAEGCASSRDLWDDIGDYACLATPAAPSDPRGTALPGLARYRVAMTVAAPATTAGVATRRVEVAVTHLDAAIDVRIAALRAEY